MTYAVARYTTREGRWLEVLEWTTEPPTQVGYYWVYNKDIGRTWAFMVEVHAVGAENTKLANELVARDSFGRRDRPLSEFTHWLGPLPMPEPPTEESENA
jgi:hypothetical protein